MDVITCPNSRLVYLISVKQWLNFKRFFIYTLISISKSIPCIKNSFHVYFLFTCHGKMASSCHTGGCCHPIESIVHKNMHSVNKSACKYMPHPLNLHIFEDAADLPHWYRKVISMTALLITGGVEGMLQSFQWRPGQSPWRIFHFYVFMTQNVWVLQYIPRTGHTTVECRYNAVHYCKILDK